MNRVVVITGASAGIGAAMARELGRRGDHLVLAARTAEALRHVAAGIESRTHVVVADVTRRGDVEGVRDETLRVFGHVDVWINNAGRGILRPVLELTDEDVDDMIAVNVKSALYGMQAIAPYFMTRGRGHIINISSFLGRVPVATPRSAYNAAKAALNALTANLRVDLKRTHPGVNVSLIMPGLVTTDFAKNARGSTGPLPAAAIGSPMKPQTAEEVAAIVADVVEHPVAEVYTNPASSPLAARYFADVERFEAESLARR
jgi:short-subunit dehydrogenase